MGGWKMKECVKISKKYCNKSDNRFLPFDVFYTYSSLTLHAQLPWPWGHLLFSSCRPQRKKRRDRARGRLEVVEVEW